MKKSLIFAVFAAAVLPVTHVFADAGTVKFTGKILDAACTVDVQSQNKDVELGTYDKSEFGAASGKTTAPVKFTLVLSACPDTVTSAVVKFDGNAEPTDTTLLAIDSGANAAKGVAINLMTADKAQLPLAGSNSYSYPLVAAVDNNLDFYAQYESTSATISAGDANASASFSVIYN